MGDTPHICSASEISIYSTTPAAEGGDAFVLYTTTTDRLRRQSVFFSSAGGAAAALIETSETIRPGTCSLPHSIGLCSLHSLTTVNRL
mmetsp:Transcript_36503/g.83266  ORF Transcript_36503/g.83266 Transcript_36503/m.83266 type:complete len:88 (-) Transcript_36503:7-270(-)